MVGRLECSGRILGYCRAGERQVSERQRRGEEAASHPGTRAVRTHGDHRVSPRVVRRARSTPPSAAASRAAAAAAARAAALTGRPCRSVVGVPPERVRTAGARLSGLLILALGVAAGFGARSARAGPL